MNKEKVLLSNVLLKRVLERSIRINSVYKDIVIVIVEDNVKGGLIQFRLYDENLNNLNIYKENVGAHFSFKTRLNDIDNALIVEEYEIMN